MSLTRQKMMPALSSLSAFSTSFRRISTLFLFLLLFAQVDSHNRSGEVHTVLKFKSLLERGSPTRTLEYWTTWKKMDKTPDPCDWYGVTCAENSTQVEQLNLWHLKQLSSLGMLSNLQNLLELDFSSNDFREKCNNISVSQDTETLTGLTPLDLSVDAFSGPIPPNVSSSQTRQYFSLEENVLIGEIPDLSGLERYPSYQRVVDLSNNNVQSTSTVVNLDPLTAVLEFFLRNTSITEFRMRGTSLFETPLLSSAPTSLTSIQVLDLSYNYLQGKIMGVAFNSTWPPALQSLDSSNNDIIGPLPDAIVMLPNLVVLDVTNNMLSGPLPKLSNKLNKRDIFFAQDNPPGLCEDPQLNCGGPLRPCPQWSGGQTSVQTWWFLMITIGEFVMIAVGSFSIAVWRWRVYRRRHQQDADLIKTLMGESAALMSLRDLKKATDNFAYSAQIGEGGFATVYTGKLSDGTIVAIKRSKREGSEKEKEQFLNEVRILSQVKHRHLVKLLGCCMENKVALLVFEFVPNGTLQEHLQRKIGIVPLSWRQRLRIAVQTADALNYLHSAANFPIYHRDIKSANILLNDELSVRVADFGVSKLSSVEATHISTLAIQGTRGYIDPEYFTSYQLTDKSDVYSFGVVLLELISAKPAIDFGRGEEDAGLVCFAQKHIESGDLQQLIDGALRETYNDLAGQGREAILHMGRLAIKCLHMRSKSRPSMNEVWKELQNLWLQLDGTPEDLGSLKESSTVSEGAVAESSAHIVLLSDCFSTDSSGFVLHNDSIGIQMSQFSHLTRIRSASSQQ